MAVRCVVFDADNTLWDFETAKTAGLAAAAEVLAAARRRAGAPEAVAVTPAGLDAAWDALVAEADAAGRLDGAGALRLSQLRRRSFALAAERAGCDDPEVAEAMAHAYFAHRHGRIALYPEVVDAVRALPDDLVVGLVTNGNTRSQGSELEDVFAFQLVADHVGLRKPDPRLFAMAAAAAGCHPNEVVSVGDDLDKDVAAPQTLGARAVWVNRTGALAPPGARPDATITDLTGLAAVLDRFATEDDEAAARVGVGPHPEPWPIADHYDPVLLAGGDRRNVVDRYRYWREAAIVADLEARRHDFHVAVENWRHDRNIGAVVRNANAFGAAAVHIIGLRRWNRRGAMATDRYLTVMHHPTVEDFQAWADAAGLAIVGIDNVAGAVPLESADLPRRCVLVFGQEGPGLSAAVVERAAVLCEITQFGSTRSLNAGVASGIAMHAWVRRHVLGP